MPINKNKPNKQNIVYGATLAAVRLNAIIFNINNKVFKII